MISFVRSVNETYLMSSYEEVHSFDKKTTLSTKKTEKQTKEKIRTCLKDSSKTLVMGLKILTQDIECWVPNIFIILRQQLNHHRSQVPFT